MNTNVHFGSYLAPFFLEWYMFQTKAVEKKNTHFMFSNYFLKIVLFEILWKNIVDPERPQVTIWHMCNSCWVPKATNKHLE
jgi:hypothetical protein